ncbi:MAG: UvrD-helicase domain-containing protein, partial [Firmicutes bacterium]|nr:UvrD-helicase domain-containing protein [Bacillota bacterium]
MNFTKEQQSAIDVRGCNVLVSAAAGSGKTGVLTERIVSRLKDGENIDELLTLTFTRAAAGEMKTRVRQKITAEAEKAPTEQRAFWQKQLALIGDAPITTLHSFCLRLLRRHYNLLPGLDPKFHITDPRRAAILRSDLLSAYLEECYTEADEEKRQRFFDLL